MWKLLTPASVTLLLSLGAAPSAYAQLPPEFEAGVVTGVYTPSAPHPFVGAAFGFSNPMFAVEVEYAGTVGQWDDKPAAYSISGNLIVKTPLRVAGAQIYGFGGIALYAESYKNGRGSGEIQALNFGAGAKVPLTGPVSLRLEYRFFTGEREASDPRKGTAPPQRLSVGLSLGF